MRRLNLHHHKVAENLAAALRKAMGDDLHAVVLYGSVARKRARRESDIDVLLVSVLEASLPIPPRASVMGCSPHDG